MAALLTEQFHLNIRELCGHLDEALNMTTPLEGHTIPLQMLTTFALDYGSLPTLVKKGVFSAKRNAKRQNGCLRRPYK